MISHRPAGSPQGSRPKRRPTPGRKNFKPEDDFQDLSISPHQSFNVNMESGQAALEDTSSGEEIAVLENEPMLVDLKSREHLHIDPANDESSLVHTVDPWGSEMPDDLDPEESIRHNAENAEDTSEYAEESPAPMEFSRHEKPVSPPSDQALHGFTFNDRVQSNTPEEYPAEDTI